MWIQNWKFHSSLALFRHSLKNPCKTRRLHPQLPLQWREGGGKSWQWLQNTQESLKFTSSQKKGNKKKWRASSHIKTTQLLFFSPETLIFRLQQPFFRTYVMVIVMPIYFLMTNNMHSQKVRKICSYGIEICN